jgi:DNA-binding GntR family transcriptional regulator
LNVVNTSPHTNLYAEAHTTASLAYQQLKRLLLLGEVPIGIRLREERLAERLGMSRTPIREALLRLHAERFLDRHPEGGYRAMNPSVQTMRQLYEVRRALELFAVRRTDPTAARDRFSLEVLHDEWASLDEDSLEPDAEFVHLDEDFHYRLAESSGNGQLAEELRRINERIRPVRSHDFITPGRIATTVREHLTIVRALLDDQVEEADRLLDQHIDESLNVVERAVGQVLERMLSVGERDNAW